MLEVAPRPAADQNDRQVSDVVAVPFADRATVEGDDVVEQRGVAITGRRELFEKIAKQGRMVGFDLRQAGDLVFVSTVMRDWVMGVGNPNLWVGGAALLSADLESDDPGGVGL